MVQSNTVNAHSVPKVSPLVLVHNGYVYGKPDSFRIDHTAYSFWTLAGFYRDELSRYSTHSTRPVYMATEALYIAEQLRRAGDNRLMGAAPSASVLVGDRVEGQRLADAFHALPELHFGDEVSIDGAAFIVAPDNNNHVRFVSVSR